MVKGSDTDNGRQHVVLNPECDRYDRSLGVCHVKVGFNKNAVVAPTADGAGTGQNLLHIKIFYAIKLYNCRLQTKCRWTMTI